MRALTSISVFTALCLLSAQGGASSATDIAADASQYAAPIRVVSSRPALSGPALEIEQTAPIEQTDPAPTGVNKATDNVPATQTAKAAASKPVYEAVRIEPKRASGEVTEITNETLELPVNEATPTETISSTRSGSVAVGPLKTLSWSIPAKRTDGSQFYQRELGGYYLTVKNILTGGVSQIHIGNPDATSYVLRNFRTGQYSFSIRSYDLDGLVSPYSPWVRVTI